MIAKVLKMIAVPIHDGEEVVAAGVVMVQGKSVSRMQNISLHKMSECKSVQAWIIFGKRKLPSLTEECPVLLGMEATWTVW